MPRLLLALAFVGATSGCGPYWKKSADLLDEPMLKVQMATLLEKGEPQDAGYAHPVDLDPSFIEACLERLYFRPAQLLQGKHRPPVVDPTLRPALAYALADGLSQASSSDRFRFRAHNPSVRLWVLPVRTLTEGAAFVDPAGTFNLAFYRLGASDDPEDTHRGWGDPTRSPRSRGSLEIVNGGQLHDSSSGKHRFWVTFPIGELPPLPVEAPPEPVVPPPGPETVPAPPPDKDPAPLTDEEVLERLRFLEELYQEGALSQEEYEKKRAELLRRGD